MKKNYLKPSTELLDLVVSNIMVDTSQGGGDNNTNIGGEDGGGWGDGANRGRGEWGNVWGGGSN